LNSNEIKEYFLFLICQVFNNLFYSASLRDLFAGKFLPLMGKLYIEELDVLFAHASTYQIGPPEEDSTYGMLGERVVYCFSKK